MFAEAMDHVQSGGLGGNQAQKFKQGPKGNFFHNRKPSAAVNKSALPGQASGPPMVSQNVRVKLPENDNEEDDMSEVDSKAELAEEEIERIKIKRQAEVRRLKHKH